jgi:hypothetical protein
MINIHLEHHEIHRYERTPEFHQDIFRNPNRMPDRLIRQLQMNESRNQGIMIELIVDYLWHDAHACSEIRESLMKLLGADRTGDSWNTWVTHLIQKTIKDSSTTPFCKHQPVRLRYWSLLLEDIIQIPCISQNLHGVQHWNVDVHPLNYLDEATKLFIFHRLFHLMGEW